MDINFTLFGEMITFGILVWLTMRFIWPPVINAMEDRRKKIAEGLEAAERGKNELALVQEKALAILHEAREQAALVIEEGRHRATEIIEESKTVAQEEGKRIVTLAKTTAAQEVEAVRQQIREQIAALAMQGVERILQRNVDEAANQALLDALIEEI